jgi:hypothetical protein
MIRSKILNSTSPKDLTTDGKQVELVTIGLFSTTTQLWKYYVCSVVGSNNNYKMTTDLHTFASTATNDNVESYGKQFKTVDEAKKFIDNFRDKWETGSNEPKQEVRDAKIKDILQETEN